jgi:hypothetical protein
VRAVKNAADLRNTTRKQHKERAEKERSRYQPRLASPIFFGFFFATFFAAFFAAFFFVAID